MNLVKTNATEAVNKALAASVANTTLRAYKARIKTLSAWMDSAGLELKDLNPTHLQSFLVSEGAKRSKSWRLQLICAINLAYETIGTNSPAKHPDVSRVMKGLNRQCNSQPKQALPITETELEQLLKNSDKLETALLCVMRDGLLRISEASALQWTDIIIKPDGTGRLVIRRSKTDQEGEGSVGFLTVRTVNALCAYGLRTDGYVFKLQPRSLARRIQRLCVKCGLGDGYSGHSLRVGTVHDLLERGASLLQVQSVGRWKSPTMPAYYGRSQLAADNAVAQYLS